MSVDVSPDGRTIVFDLLGDLYTLPIERRRGDAHRRRDVVREPAHLVARRQDDRVPQRPQRRREPLDRQRRRLEPARRSARTGGPTTGRRSWCRRRGRPTASTSSCRSRGRRTRARSGCSCTTATAAPACASAPPPPPQPRPDAHGPAAAAAAEQDGRGRLARRPVHLLRAAHRRLHLQRPLSALAGLSPRSRDRRRVAGDQRPGQRDAAGALARRQVAGLRHALQDRDRPARPQSRDRRRALAGLSGDARRSGIARHAATRCPATTSCPTASR